MLRSTDARSTIHTNNLVATCGKCHPGIGTRLAKGEMKIHNLPGADKGKPWLVNFVAANLAAIGAHVDERPDGWIVSRGRPRAADIRTQGDHRIAMAFAIAALTGVAGTVRIDDPACAAVSYPSFWTDLETLSR